LLLGVATLAACGSRTSNPVVSEPPQREGAGFASVTLQYADNHAQIASDGAHMVFMSGRDSTGGTLTRKAYKATVPDGDVELPPVARVTHVDLGFEQAAYISPSGEWVIVAVAHNNGTQLYLQDFAGAKEAVAITNAAADAAADPSITFSPDSLLFAYRTLGATGDAIKVVAIGGGTEAELKAAVTATTAAERAAQATFLANDGANYRLAIGTYPSAAITIVDFKTKTFAAPADAATAAAVDWLPARRIADGVHMVAASDRALLLETPASSGATTPRTGTYVPPEGDEGRVAVVKSMPMIYPYGVAAPAPFPAAIGYEEVFGDLSADGLTSYFLSRQLYRCVDDPGELYGPSFVVVGADGKPNFLSPRLTSADPLKFEVTGGLCDRTREGLPFTRLDDRLMNGVVNAGATATKYRIAYESKFSTHFDADCVLKGGDTEIYVLDVDGEQRWIRSVSRNQAVLTDDDRGSNAPCTL
jgi:hypothetical protein